MLDVCIAFYMFFEFLYHLFIMFCLFLFVLLYCYLPQQYYYIHYFNRSSVLYEQSCWRVDAMLARMLVVSIVLYQYR